MSDSLFRRASACHLSWMAACLAFSMLSWGALAAETDTPRPKPSRGNRPAARGEAARARMEARQKQGATERGARARENDQTSDTPKKKPSPARTTSPEKSISVAKRVDELLNEQLAQAGAVIAPAAADDDYLRRVTLDLAGTLPTPDEVTLFGLDPDPAKRQKLVDRLLESDAYAQNWARYWRDVIFLRATEMRSDLMIPEFEEWMAGELARNAGWDSITADLITATGDVRENGATALLFAQGGQPAEIAGEVSRIFLGIQIQCANCHDHRSDKWKREQFHELAAFFPRVQVRPVQNATPRTFQVLSIDEGRGAGPLGGALFSEDPEQAFRRADRNRDQRLTESEVARTPLARAFPRILENGDTDGDKAMTLDELRNMPLPGGMRRGTLEYYMPDLDNPQARGTRIEPALFIGDRQAETELSDAERRATLAKYLSSSSNPWFAKAFVNRMWAELLGRGFYTPIDDLGDERSPVHPEVLNLLAREFTATKYDVKWLMRTIVSTDAYERSLGTSDAASGALVFAAAEPTRLRADQLYASLTTVFQVDEIGNRGRVAAMAGGMRSDRSPRGQFRKLFEYDPSTPQSDLTGDVPQALFMMNSQALSRMISARGDTPLAAILREQTNDADAASELYLLVLARTPSDNELKVCAEYVNEVGNREEAFEDLMWGLVNSTEFLTKR